MDFLVKKSDYILKIATSLIWKARNLHAAMKSQNAMTADFSSEQGFFEVSNYCVLTVYIVQIFEINIIYI